MFINIKEQELPKSILSHFITAQKIPQSFLFYGPEGVGKFLTALHFAKILNCTNQSIDLKGDDDCLSCKKIETNNHPDLIIVNRIKGTIKTEEIRELRRKANLKSFESPNKIIIIDNAEKMTTEAGNTLLKTLEEPPQNTYLILITAQVETILSTIRSRCIKIPFKPLALKTIQTILESKNVPEDKAYSIALLSEGSMKNANDLLDTENYNDIQKTLTSILSLLSAKFIKAPELIALSHFFSKPKEKEKLIFEKILNILYLFWRDMLIRNTGIHSITLFVPEQIRFTIEEAGILKIIHLLDEIKNEMIYNINLSLAIEYLILETHKLILQYKKE